MAAQALIDARGRVANDPAFAAAVDDWEARLAPMAEGFAEVAPPAHMWARIERALEAQSAGDSPVVHLKRRERLWRGWAAGMTALAAGLALVLALDVARPLPRMAAPRSQSRSNRSEALWS